MLKLLALITLLVGLLPISIVLHHKIIDQTQIYKVVVNSCFIFIGGYLGFWCSKGYARYIQKYKQHLLQKIVIGLICYLVTFCPLIGIILFGYYNDIKALLCIGILSSVAYVMVLKNQELIYSDILDINRYAILAGICTICMFIVPTPWITATFFVITVFYALIQNQSIVDKMLIRTRKNTKVVTSIRNYNAFLVLLFLILFGLGYSFKKYIIIIIKSILVIVRTIIIGITKILYWLLHSNNVEDLKQIEENSNPFLEEASSYQSDNLFIGIISLVFIFIMIRFRGIIYDAILKLLSSIKAFFIQLFRITVDDERINQSYYDHVETVKPEKVKKREIRNNQLNKVWKKQYKNFYKTIDCTKKYRLGYKLITAWYKLKQVNIVPSDTTLEILEKTLEYKEIESMDRITKAYNEIRYGERHAEEKDIDAITKTLDTQYKQLH